MVEGNTGHKLLFICSLFQDARPPALDDFKRKLETGCEKLVLSSRESCWLSVSYALRKRPPVILINKS